MKNKTDKEKKYTRIVDNRFLNQEKFNKYIGNFDSLEGWFELGDVRLFETIDYIQKKNKIKGNLFEIGTYHGKTTIMLVLMAESNKDLVGVCDIFELQKKNISGSGVWRGNKKKFLQNIRKYCEGFNFSKIYEKESQKLTLKEIGMGYRFFHIDGGHSVEETFNDLCLAEKVISKKGIIVIDDYFSKFWPGVSGGVCKFFLEKPNHLAPLVIGHNKFVFCRASEYKYWFKELICEKYKDYLSGAEFFTTLTKFFGFDVIVIFKGPELGIKLTIIEKIFRFSKKLKLKSRRYERFIKFLNREI